MITRSYFQFVSSAAPLHERTEASRLLAHDTPSDSIRLTHSREFAGAEMILTSHKTAKSVRGIPVAGHSSTPGPAATLNSVQPIPTRIAQAAS